MQNDQMNQEFVQHMSILANPGATKEMEKLSDEDRKKIANGFIKLYRGLAMNNWARSGTLGKAMYAAQSQMKSFIETKKSDNIAVTYLRQIQASYNVVLAKQIMTNPDRDRTLGLDAKHRNAYTSTAARLTNAGMAEINAVIAQFGANARQVTKGADKMQGIMTENGTMTYSAHAANATKSSKVANPSEQMLESDAQKQEQMQMQMTQQSGTVKIRPQSENGSMMQSAKSANNKTMQKTPNPSKREMPVNQPGVVRDVKSGFKVGKERIKNMNQAKELTPEQKRMLWLRQQQNGGMAA